MAKSNNSDRLLLAALDLIAERGFHDAPISLIAKRAGVAEGTVYRYYKSKEDLIHKVFLYIAEEFYKNILVGYLPQKSIRERFFHICTAALRYYIDNPRRLRYSDQFNTSPYGLEMRSQMMHRGPEIYGTFVTLLIEGVSHKKLKDLPIPILVSLTFGAIRNIARCHFEGTPLDDALIAQSVEACWDSVKRARGSQSLSHKS